jgi:hypothetical protein
VYYILEKAMSSIISLLYLVYNNISASKLYFGSYMARKESSRILQSASLSLRRKDQNKYEKERRGGLSM